MKVWEPLPPELIVPVSKLPSLAVAVWGACPELCHVTVSPTAIVTLAAEKKKSPIVTLALVGVAMLALGLIARRASDRSGRRRWLTLF